MTEPVLLLAASGLARETLAAIRAIDERDGTSTPVGILDDDEARHGEVLLGSPVLGPTAMAADLQDRLVLCAGRGAARRAMAQRLDGLGVDPARYRAVIHPAASVGEGSHVAPGAVLLAEVVLTADVQVGAHVVAMPGAVLTHDDVVEDYATICAGVVLGGSVRVGVAAYLGMCSSVREGVRVGPDAVLGMGATLLGDLPQGQTWVGVPARSKES
ncbi:acetyltransferase [Janibacter melonis]|uniref:Acetyltransferase n=1 Tax=Janibacter melonis TaxID=262209 RepID=A0A5P8FNV2_9MICO|nr:acetyltransferase [Janibacter melonis]QFQ31266.1 acetyltransferase [Janibacter melonis]